MNSRYHLNVLLESSTEAQSTKYEKNICKFIPI